MSDADQTGLDEVVKCPVSGCTLTVDIVLRSSDKVLIGAHQANLAQFSEGFPSSDVVTAPKEPVDLAESGDVLALLVHFMHKCRHPNLANLMKAKPPRKRLFALAEAAEKYMVYPAMSVCNLRIAERMEDDLLNTFAYATKFDYLDIADKVAPHLIDMNAALIRRSLAGAHSNVLLAWFCYREQFLEIADAMAADPQELSLEEVGGLPCTSDVALWRKFRNAVVAALPQTTNDRLGLLGYSVTRKGVGPQFVTECKVYKSLDLEKTCVSGICPVRARRWEAECSQALAEVRPFSTFLSHAAAPSETRNWNWIRIGGTDRR
ncbi:hypothetical protein FA13DRAFT_1819702 [Coprinellus micaceus]|uniref:BTB domain-containing protein n=1 Tax=Coprinellus micaceus TaxID=71717 RepID=A0A4Y7SHA1_COPMI|nr:hypothetical protein FA13DRAFT_1819702 [Coprinellus micaceus]